MEKLNTVLNDLDLDEKTDYEKCVEIMRWIAKNVKYDTHYAEHPEKPAKTQHPHDMTGAVLDGYCVCDGYAGVFYYMANAVGLHALYDDGWAYGGGHAWNLVQIDGTYYYIDLTGCASNFDKNGEIKDEFLWGSDNHYFRKEYVPDTDNIKNTYSNISKDDYFKEHSVCKGNHTMHETGEQLATCEDDAEIEYMCINEGCKYTKWTKTADALGHQMDNGRSYRNRHVTNQRSQDINVLVPMHMTDTFVIKQKMFQPNLHWATSGMKAQKPNQPLVQPLERSQNIVPEKAVLQPKQRKQPNYHINMLKM